MFVEIIPFIWILGLLCCLWSLPIGSCQAVEKAISEKAENTKEKRIQSQGTR